MRNTINHRYYRKKEEEIRKIASLCCRVSLLKTPSIERRTEFHNIRAAALVPPHPPIVRSLSSFLNLFYTHTHTHSLYKYLFIYILYCISLVVQQREYKKFARRDTEIALGLYIICVQVVCVHKKSPKNMFLLHFAESLFPNIDANLLLFSRLG